jgi:hypothetical protein
MKGRYLLYIDILGFAKLIQERPKEIAKLFTVLDTLDAHTYKDFRVVAFSDTILIYSVDRLTITDDPLYFTTRLGAFARDLLYKLVGSRIFFRGLLTFGQFEFQQRKRISSFWGTALVNAYLREKEIKCTGLFVDGTCPVAFATAPYNNNVQYVYLNESLEHLVDEDECSYSPSPPWEPFPEIYDDTPLEETDEFMTFPWDLQFCKDIHYEMNHQANPEIRLKFWNTWRLLWVRYRSLLADMEKNGFNLERAWPNYDWSWAERIMRRADTPFVSLAQSEAVRVRWAGAGHRIHPLRPKRQGYRNKS